MKNLENNKKVLFLSLSGIGNLLMQLPAIEAAKKAHPAWHSTVWVAPRGTKAIALAQPFIDEVLEMPVKGSISRHAKNILALRKRHFDIAIMLSPGQLAKGALYMKLAGIPVRIGNAYPYKGNPQSSKFLTHAIPEDPALHDIEQNLQLLDLVDISPPIIPYYAITIPQEAVDSSKSYQLSAKSYIGIHPGSASNFQWKRWPLERFGKLAKILHTHNPNVQFLIFGGPDEEGQKQALANMINSLSPSAAAVISTPLLTTAAIIKRHCSIFISNDSGLMHLAAAVGVPTVGIFGPTNENQTGPRGPKSIAVRAPGTKPVYNTETAYDFGSNPHPAILALTPEMVFEQIKSQLPK